MVPSANLLGFAGGELAKKLPKVFGVLLETTLSSVVEIVLFMVLIHNDQNGTLIPVIQAAILGSILANLLLCLGLCFFFGGLGREDQVFHEAVSEVGSGLLLVAGFGLLIPSAFYAALNSSSTNTTTTPEEITRSALKISRATAIILLAAFLMYLFYNLHSHHTIFDEILEIDENRDEDREKEKRRAKLTLTECLIAIVISLTCVCMAAVFLVQEIHHIVVEQGVSDNFMGLILVPVVEKAAEHLTAIDEAWDNQINFALFHCLGPSIQTALLNAPLAVIVGWCLSKDVSLNFEIFMIVVVVLSILVVGNFLRDGKSNYLEGGLCVLIYIIIAVTTWYYPQVVISALKDRNITPKRDEIATAFQDNSESAKHTQWVQEHLTMDTLLSEEELTLYSKLEGSGCLNGIFHHDIDSTRPLLDEDLQLAIEALKTSTAEIERQTDILTAQHDILSRQLKLDDDRRAKQLREVERLRQKYDAGRQNTAAASSELAHELEVSLKNESEKSTMGGKKILSALTTRLKEDDKLLSDLERLATGVKSSEDDATIMNQTSELSAILAQYVAEEICCRLDRIYLERVSSGQAVSDAPETEAMAGLEEELDSLYPEIDILAEMSTKQQFVEPIMRELQNYHGQLRIASHEKLDQILRSVTVMTTSAEGLITSLQDRESFCATLEAFTSTYRSEVGHHILETTASRRDTMRRFSTLPTLTAAQPTKQGGPFPESEALSGLLRRIGVSYEAVFQPEETERGAQVLLQERQHMLDGLRRYSIASDSPLAAELLPTDRAIQLLSSSLETDSQFTASLSSVEHEKSLAELESKLGRIQKGIERLNQNAVYQRDKNQEKFLERWS
ncbi:vacuolar H+/Ca2+ exchanger [Aspergillus granulosus]|uniref:Vacuolar H+/Ca2+ exchanger n=1 Tax=Aspergillus granulosus TaxID=176169 RepID=A0ABR4H8P3_9EURO